MARVGLIILPCNFLLAACDLDPIGGSFSKASWEIGNTYALAWPHRVYACQQVPLRPTDPSRCSTREIGSFTVDDAMMVIQPRIIYVHLALDDGQSGWMIYNDFRMQQFTEPARTRLAAKLDMTTDAIRSAWGEPTSIAPREWNKLVLQDWTYAGVGTLSFKDGKLIQIKLSRSLASAD